MLRWRAKLLHYHNVNTLNLFSIPLDGDPYYEHKKIEYTFKVDNKWDVDFWYFTPNGKYTFKRKTTTDGKWVLNHMKKYIKVAKKNGL